MAYIHTRGSFAELRGANTKHTQLLCTYHVQVQRLQPGDTFEAEPFASDFLAYTLATMHFGH
jgi:hypothetical protein